jgi:transposase-like protein
MPLLFESRRITSLPKRIDDELKARAVRLVNDHQGEYSSLTAAAAVVAKQLGVGRESVRRARLQRPIGLDVIARCFPLLP